MRKRGQHLDFEVNLIPFIDLLSVCICFLLLTAVWVQIASVNVKQAVGGQAQSETAKKPVLWVMMGQSGVLNLSVQDSNLLPQKLSKLRVGGLEGKPHIENLDKVLQELVSLDPTLRTALIQPQAKSSYQDIIDLMDGFKKRGLIDLGVVPL